MEFLRRGRRSHLAVMKIVLGNIDYESHMTSEGNELQQGLKFAEWKLIGPGYWQGDHADVKTILETYKPETVFVSDKRDWDENNGGCFRKGLTYRNLEALAESSAFKVVVVKDAGGMVDYHRHFCEQVKANAVVNYYHPLSVVGPSPFLRDYELIRTYHSVDSEYIQTLNFNPLTRKRAVVSGAVSSCYPLRERVFTHAGLLDCETIRHPGYGNRGAMTPSYLQRLSQYKVHIATASSYGFALRKIIESVAIGATPITDLPRYDDLPGIDGALLRIGQDSTVAQIKEAIDFAEANWNPDERREYQQIALKFYDWKYIGLRLSAQIELCQKGLTDFIQC